MMTLRLDGPTFGHQIPTFQRASPRKGPEGHSNKVPPQGPVDRSCTPMAKRNIASQLAAKAVAQYALQYLWFVAILGDESVCTTISAQQNLPNAQSRS